DPREAAAILDDATGAMDDPMEFVAINRGLTLVDGEPPSRSPGWWARLLRDNKLPLAFHVETLNRRVVDAISECRLRAARLKVALLLYLAENQGEPAPDLDALVKRNYLTTVPLDPFDGQPLRYRLSDGKDVNWGRAADDQPEGAPPMQPACGVVWSVGPDG